MNTEQEVLKPCPFCGGKAVLSNDHVSAVGTFYAGLCTGCGARGAQWSAEATAIAAWNRRSSDEQAEVVGHTANCCNCGRIVDTREEAEGGDKFGAEASDGRWLCSMECWDAVFRDEGPYASPPAVAKGGVTEEMVRAANKVFWDTSSDPEASRDMHAALTAALAVRDEGIREGWRHDPPFITSTSARPDYYVTVKVRDIKALHDAHDIVLRAFSEAVRLGGSNADPH